MRYGVICAVFWAGDSCRCLHPLACFAPPSNAFGVFAYVGAFVQMLASTCSFCTPRHRVRCFHIRRGDSRIARIAPIGTELNLWHFFAGDSCRCLHPLAPTGFVRYGVICAVFWAGDSCRCLHPLAPTGDVRYGGICVMRYGLPPYAISAIFFALTNYFLL